MQKFTLNTFMEYWEEALGKHPHLILEIGYNRTTDYMVHIWDGAGVGIAKASLMLSTQEITLEEACLKAVIQLNEAYEDLNLNLDPYLSEGEIMK